MQKKSHITKKLFISKRTKMMAVFVTLILPVFLIFYTCFMNDRPQLHFNADKTWIDVLIQNSDVLLAFVFLIISSVPFYLIFDKKKAQARDLVPIALMAAMCIVGRAAFSIIPLPNFKPVSAIIIITGAAFGPESGYLTGTLAGLLSNFLFGQGPWTPWQMFCWGIIGFISGILYKAGIFGKLGESLVNSNGKRQKPISLCVFGFLCGIGYGWIMNLYYLIGYVNPLTWKSVFLTYLSSLYFDISHGICTAMVLWFVGDAWVRKLLRIKKKFGLDGEAYFYQMPPSGAQKVNIHDEKK